MLYQANFLILKDNQILCQYDFSSVRNNFVLARHDWRNDRCGFYENALIISGDLAFALGDSRANRLNAFNLFFLFKNVGLTLPDGTVVHDEEEFEKLGLKFCLHYLRDRTMKEIRNFSTHRKIS